MAGHAGGGRLPQAQFRIEIDKASPVTPKGVCPDLAPEIAAHALDDISFRALLLASQGAVRIFHQA